MQEIEKMALIPIDQPKKRKEDGALSTVFQHRVVRVEIYLWRFSGVPPLYINVYDGQKSLRFYPYYNGWIKIQLHIKYWRRSI